MSEYREPTLFPPPPALAGAALPNDSVHVELDWWAYWERFKEAHGSPVEHEGRLLFPDGWAYSRSDPAGPEWPPPALPEELLVLQVRYWLARLGLVQREHTRLREVCDGLRGLQARKDQPLQRRFVVRDEETGKRQTLKGSVDVDAIEAGRLAWLAEDVNACRDKLKELLGTGAASIL